MTSPGATVPSRRALLIGIDAYVAPDPALTGCVNDVTLMRELLVGTFHFPERNVITVTNEGATRLGIVTAMERLIAETGDGDIVVIHYAGHGSRVTDREGDEPNGLDSTWHTVDSSAYDRVKQAWVGEQRDILDDEIALWIQDFGARTDNLTIIVDACHSGGISRDGLEAHARGTVTDDRPVGELPPSPITRALPRQGERSVSGWGSAPRGYVLIAGCRDDETSKEVLPWPEQGRTRNHGALTWYLTRNLREAEQGTTYRDVFELTCAQLTREFPSQHPQMEGTVDRAIFGITDLPVARYRLVTARNDRGEVTLRGGAAHQVTVGSRYAIYPPGSRDFSGAVVAPLAEVVVTRVGAVTATAQLVGGVGAAPGEVGEMCRAVEVAHEFGTTRWDVRCEADAAGASSAEALRALLARSTDVGVATAEPAAFVATLDGGHWTVRDATGARVAPVVPVGREALVARNIETVARWRRLLALRNDDRTSVLQPTSPVRLDMMKWRNGEWRPAPREADGTVVYDVDDRIAFQVKKSFEGDLFLTLLDLDSTGAVVRVWPNTTMPPLTGPTSFAITPGPGESDWTMPWPEGESMEPEQSADDAWEYRKEHWLLLVTKQEADFSAYEQSGLMDGSVPDAAPSRTIRKGPPALADDWMVLCESIRIRRPRVS